MMSKTLGFLTAVAFSTRFYNLSVPSYVCWDEVHFGKMAVYYLNRTNFLDVHPPLGKMFIALAGLVTGFDGKFNFVNTGDDYVTEDTNVHYYGMRAFSAICGSLVIPLIYSTVKIMTGSREAALITSALLVFDCGFISLSQYIILDPVLLFFMAASLFCNAKYSVSMKTYQIDKVLPGTDQKRNLAKKYPYTQLKSFSFYWWMFLALTGLCLGCMLSVKWVGLFTIVYVGCWTIKDLWILLGNTKEVSIVDFTKHFLARSVCLIFIPIFVYTGAFAVHYHVLNRTGMADCSFSSKFQTCLKGNQLFNVSLPPHVAYGSGITLKYHNSLSSGLLHSHNKSYPTKVMEDPKQQVTLYFYVDRNNYWEIMKPNVTENEKNEKELLKHGDIFRLQHMSTKHYLHSCSRPAPLSRNKQIVSCSNATPEEATNQLWKIEVVNPDNEEGKIRMIHTKFRLIHVNSGCVLQTSFRKLPGWASNQYEVVCSHHHKDIRTSLWNVELNYHRHLPRSQLEICQMTFWERFVESHLIMASSNAQIKGDEGERVSKPWQWPLNYKGQIFSFNGENSLRVYFLGNPLVYLLNLITIIVSPIFFLTMRIAELRALSRIKSASPIPLPSDPSKMKLRSNILDSSSCHISACKWFLFGWFAHYAPFLLMSRVVYFHHYYPAFIFSCCLSGCFLDLVFKNCAISFAKLLRGRILPSNIAIAIYLIFGVLLLESFYLYSPLCYGMTGPFSHDKRSIMYGLKLFGHWEI